MSKQIVNLRYGIRTWHAEPLKKDLGKNKGKKKIVFHASQFNIKKYDEKNSKPFQVFS